ncbi:MAG: OmpA family protein [Phreatobacter sp.]|uniref:OmpA family protein n=1 Tax=Phreatobacter sp. TaxID=1966341 RepID=UPI0027325B77|nr:OmpA family protein [Phreatobacter sp.]MDP2800858.1 OmpA family protein [Phreatobacter sp.]
MVTIRRDDTMRRAYRLFLGLAVLAGLLASAGPGPARAQTSAEPYQLSLVREGDLVALGGSVPSEAVREAVLAAIRAVSADTSVIDMTAVAEGAPAGFVPAATFAAGLAARLRPGAVLLSGTDIMVEGRPEGLAGQAAVSAALAALPQGFRLQRQALSPPLVRPFALSLTRGGEGLVLSGVVAAAEEKVALVAFAGSLGIGPVTDRLVVAAGAPDGFDRLAAARFALTQMARLTTGTASVADRALTLEGQAADRSGFAAVNLALRAGALPAGLTLAGATIAAPVISPYGWFAEKGPEGVRLQGYVPSEAARAEIRAAAEALFAPLALTEAQELAAGAPQGFVPAAIAAMGQLVLLERGRATLYDSRLIVTGEASSLTSAAAVRAAIEGSAPFGFTVAHMIAAPAIAAPATAATAVAAPAAPPSTAACIGQITQEMAAGGIVFQFGRDEMRPESQARLRRIAALMAACPTVRFSVEGHTDSDGIPAQNVDLSHRRAQAVVVLLVRQGVEASRLLSEGHGATRPLVANDSPANKARNRRIEIIAR